MDHKPTRTVVWELVCPIDTYYIPVELQLVHLMVLLEPSILSIAHHTLHADRDVLCLLHQMHFRVRFLALCLGEWVLPPLSEYYHTLPYLEESCLILLGACPAVDWHPHQAPLLYRPYEDVGLVSPASYPQPHSALHGHQYQGLLLLLQA